MWAHFVAPTTYPSGYLPLLKVLGRLGKIWLVLTNSPKLQCLVIGMVPDRHDRCAPPQAVCTLNVQAYPLNQDGNPDWDRTIAATECAIRGITISRRRVLIGLAGLGLAQVNLPTARAEAPSSGFVCRDGWVLSSDDLVRLGLA